MKMLSTVSRALCCTAVAAMTGFLAQSADAQFGQWVFGQTPDEYGDRVTTRTCRWDDRLRYRSRSFVSTMPEIVSWMLRIEGFDPQAVITTSDGGFAAAGLFLLDNERLHASCQAGCSGQRDVDASLPGVSQQ